METSCSGRKICVKIRCLKKITSIFPARNTSAMNAYNTPFPANYRYTMLLHNTHQTDQRFKSLVNYQSILRKQNEDCHIQETTDNMNKVPLNLFFPVTFGRIREMTSILTRSWASSLTWTQFRVINTLKAKLPKIHSLMYFQCIFNVTIFFVSLSQLCPFEEGRGSI